MYRFGDFELDLDRYELRRGGDAIRTEPRVLELLHYLIERRDRVVPKEELLDSLWPDVHVSESALTSTIRDARRALGDAPSDARWIRTIYGRGFRFAGDVQQTSAAPVIVPHAQRRSIAVLPFADLSPARDQAHFCDGIAEELINTLARLDELRVISRAAAFDFRADDDLRVLGDKLDVHHILRGSVRKADDRLRITVHLVDVRNGHHVWSEKYDRQTGDIFALQEEIAENVARVLLGVLTERNRNAIKSTPVRLDAYEFYLKGRTYLSQRALEAAIGMFEIGLEFDRDYGPAYAGLADALAEMAELDGDAQLIVRADAASQRAVELAPHLAESHISRGRVLALEKRYRDAAAELQLALAISPGSAEAQERLRALDPHV
ncbi:MAG: winged helix-turn-helix domain-containing protein [Acidobacteria bacterium]|nr:winged helix-turn-helix domain-containing protein [Acidobacteriota bacterium]MBV9475519.1 winged helix-turn-helix domain-containing protein [Acidobacteriota bacterium]